MIFIFLFFALILVYVSVRSFLGGVAYLAYFRQELARPANSFTPFATVIAPCKGLDQGLRENLSALLKLAYPAYEVIFVVDDDNDPAVPVIREIEEDLRSPDNAPGPAVRLIVAPRSTDSGQKVENILEAVKHLDPRSEVIAFVDSDARPQPHWLKHLIAPLENNDIGIATGYRWFVSPKMTLAGELRSVWNASVASALGPKSSFCWAGSMAIRRSLWERLAISERLKGTLSDDFVCARVIKEAGLDIRLVPQALTPSIENCTLGELFEFTTRQMKLTRVYAAPLWLASFLGAALYCLVMATALMIVVFSRSNNWLVWTAIATLALVTSLSIGKAWLRLKAVTLVIPEAYRHVIPQLTLWAITPPLFLWNCVSALFSRTIHWRGTTYTMHSASKTERVADEK